MEVDDDAAILRKPTTIIKTWPSNKPQTPIFLATRRAALIDHAAAVAGATVRAPLVIFLAGFRHIEQPAAQRARATLVTENSFAKLGVDDSGGNSLPQQRGCRRW
jgi:hypothetical protein